MRKSNLFELLVLGLFSLLPVGCQAVEVQPSPTISREEPPRTSYPTEQPTEIVIPTSTNTPAPTETPIPSPKLSLPTATLDWTGYDLEASISASPDGMWVARIVVAFPTADASGSLTSDMYHTQVRVLSASDSSVGWTVVDEWSTVGVGMTTPTVMRWVQDGESFYIGDTGWPDGCGPPFILNVRRVDLRTGQVTPLDGDWFGSLSVSPDGDYLVEFSNRIGLVVHDLNNGELREIAFAQPEGDWWPGWIVWSPDGREFLFPVKTNPCSASEKMTSSIWLASLESEGASPLVQDEPRSLSLQSWPAACMAQINDAQGGVWWLDPCTGELSQTPPPGVADAMDVLLGFFDALHQGNYADAVEYYGGSYETLQNNNESIDPDDHAALWSNACQVNGYTCLPVSGYVLISQTNQDELRFSVTFDRDGETFVLGPCCGASIIDQPPVMHFTYTLKKDQSGAYRVQELPVYVP